MDLNAILSTLTQGDALGALGKAANIDVTQVQSILTEAVPHLLGGLHEKANDPETVTAVAAALDQHGAKDTSDVAVYLSQVDHQDGAAIANHLLGDQASEKTAAIAAKSGADENLVSSLLSQATPLLMSLVGQHTTAQGGQDAEGGLGGVLSGLLGNTDVSGVVSGLLGGLLK